MMMKKNVKKISALLLTLIMMGSIAACGGGGVNQGGGEVITEDGKLSGELQIIAPDLGFGLDWLRNLEEGFETKNPDVKVTIKSSTLTDKVHVYLTSNKANPYDLVFCQTSQVFRYAETPNTIPGIEFCYENLKDVYDTIPEGEDKSIKEKMYDGIYDYFKTDDNSVYAMPNASTVFGLIYNTNLISKDELPNTTDELIELCKSVESRNTDVDAIVWTKDAEYFEEVFELWWAQYQGRSEWYSYFKSRDIEVLKQPGRQKSLEVISDLIDYETGYADSDSPGLEYIPAQTRLMRGEAAIYPCGGWLENEMDEFFKSGTAPVDFMPTPVISSIVETLEYRNSGEYMSDAMLSAVIDAVDSGATEYAGISKADFDRIKEARTMYYYENLIDSVVIPSFANAKNLAKAFLVYMYSNEGIEAYTRANSGGSLPVYYDYSGLYSDFSAMQKSRLAIQGSKNSYIFRPRHGSIMSTNFYGTKIQTALGGVSDTLTPEKIVSNTYDFYNANNQHQWNLLLK